MRILTLSSVFPNAHQRFLGLFIKERMRFVAKSQRVRVLAPLPKSPLDPIARRLKPGYRPAAPQYNVNLHGLLCDYPPLLSFPGLFKSFESSFYFASLFRFIKTLKKRYDFDLIDAHFAYPDGVAAAIFAKYFDLPFTVTLRGTEVHHAKIPLRRIQMKWALKRAQKVICVSNSLSEIAKSLGVEKNHLKVIPNGVDHKKFSPVNKSSARSRLNISKKDKVLLTVGGLVPRKGFHRVMEILPDLLKKHERLVYVMVGGASVEGDYSGHLKELAKKLDLSNRVRFEGAISPDLLSVYYSAADLFVLPTSNEGWANVFLESLACGTPVVTTDVGGNKEVIAHDKLGTVVPFGDKAALLRAVDNGLAKKWDTEFILHYARQRDWFKVADDVINVFKEIV